MKLISASGSVRVQSPVGNEDTISVEPHIDGELWGIVLGLEHLGGRLVAVLSLEEGMQLAEELVAVMSSLAEARKRYDRVKQNSEETCNIHCKKNERCLKSGTEQSERQSEGV